MSEDTSAKRANRRRRITRAGRRRALRMPAGVAGETWSPPDWNAEAEAKTDPPAAGEASEPIGDVDLKEPAGAAGDSVWGTADDEIAGAEIAQEHDDDDLRPTEELYVTGLPTPSPPSLDDDETETRIQTEDFASIQVSRVPREAEGLVGPHAKLPELFASEPELQVSSVVIAPSKIISDPPPPLLEPKTAAVAHSRPSVPANGMPATRGGLDAAASPPVDAELDEAALQLVDVDEAEVESPPTNTPPPPRPTAARPDAASLPSPPRAEMQAPAVRTKPPPPAAVRAEMPVRRPPPPPSSNKQEEDRQKRKQVRQWWERFFSDDYLMTVLPPTAAQIAKQVDFIEASLGLNKGGTILDVGCGLGLHSIELSKRGYLVVGLDLSLAMITRAAEAAQEQSLKINFVHADIREMEFDGAFDRVICMGTTFGFFDEESNRDVLARLQHALRPGGRLLLDVANRDYVVGCQPNLVWFEGDECVCMEESEFNYFNSRLNVKRTMMREDGRQSNAEYSLRLYALHELGQLMQQLGFRVIEVSGQEAIRGAFFGVHSPRILMLAERRTQARSSLVTPERNSAEMSRAGLGPASSGNSDPGKTPKQE